VQPEDLRFCDIEVPEPAEGRPIIRSGYLSVDPYPRLYLSPERSDGTLFGVDATIHAFGVRRVIASRSARFPEDEWVTGRLGWTELATSDGRGVDRFDPALGPVSAALGRSACRASPPGRRHADRRPGSRGGRVRLRRGRNGRPAGQGAWVRVIGSAGSPEKVAWLRELGFDAAFDHRERPVAEALAEHAPDGLDVYWDNVGGAHLEAAIETMRPSAG
jgi:NADPH-dependent curcumin reductase CurA